MDHDQLFKKLLTVFFREFVELFLPDVTAYLDPDSLEFLDKEVFTDVTDGDRHEVDIIVKARFRGQETFFLVHVEAQAYVQRNFPRRMFLYFARLHEKFALPVYPVVIFSYKTPKRAEPDHYEVVFPGKTVLQFEYTTIQLNRLPWRQFIEQPNPVAVALMSRMQMAPSERPKVKLECLRLLATLKLDPARSHLIGGFIESYLKLNAEETRQYNSEFENLTPEGKEKTMEMLTSWGREGLHKGKEELVVLQMERLLGSVSPTIIERVEKLPSKQLDELGLALLNFKSVADLENWLLQHRPKRSGR